jgi:hypothetical protein
MFNKYGCMILKKGCILYHSSYYKFKYKNNIDKPFLFCSFHPSEYEGNTKYVHLIKLKKNIKLFFMVKFITKNKVVSSLDRYTNNNLSKLKKKNLIKMSKLLKKYKFNGWFTSIENGVNVEVALLNNTNLFKYYGTKKFSYNYNNAEEINNYIKIKKWGPLFKICTIEKPIKLYINIKYKKMIEKYKDYEKKTQYLLDTVFQVILDNAIIKYHNNNGNNIDINKYVDKNNNLKKKFNKIKKIKIIKLE